MSLSVLEREMVVECDGEPIVVILPYDDYVALVKRLEDLEDVLSVAQA